MPIEVGHDAVRATHHLKLADDAGNKVGLILCNSRGEADPTAITRSPTDRTSLKTTSGNQSYSDFEKPWTPIPQTEFTGGRGKEDFDDDMTRYSDGYRANTLSGRIILGPQETYMTGLHSSDESMPGSLTWVRLLSGSRKYLAVKFTASATYDCAYIYMYFRRRGTPPANLIVELCSDDGSDPGTVLQTATITTTNISDTIGILYRASITAESLTSGTVYWVKVYSSSADDENNWAVGVNDAAGTTKESSDDTTWTASTIDLYYRLTPTETAYETVFFKYKMAQYCVRSTASTVKLYINGDRGVADANTGALTTLVDASKSWTTNQWQNCIVLITAGTGSTEKQPWRLISSNTSTALTLSETWTITHDTTTEYVILAANSWTEITDPAHGLTQPVRNVLVINNVVYFAQGDDTNSRRMRWYNNAGTATYQFAEESTNNNKFQHLQPVYDATNGIEIWRSNNKDASSYISVSKSAVKDWGTDLSFAAGIQFKDNYGRITGLEEYGTTKQLWVFREGSIFYINSGKADEIPLREIRSMYDTENGKAHLVHNVYLYFNLGDGLERYYSSSLDDVGPNRDDGLPANRQGPIAALLGYPGTYYAAIDAGSSGYSSVLGNGSGNLGSGWFEIYRAPAAGQRIQAMDFQAIPGDTLDRMYIAVGEDIIWIGFPSGSTDPTKDSNYRYTYEAAIETGYAYAGLYDAYKYYKNLKIFAEDLVEDEQVIEADYKWDDETSWTPLDDVFDESPISEVDIGDGLGKNARRLAIRLRLMSNDNSKTPMVKTTVIEAITRIPVKYVYSLAYRVMEDNINLQGEPDDLTYEQIQEQLDEWATQATPLTMNCHYKLFDDKTVFIDPQPLSPFNTNKDAHIASLVLNEI